MKQIAIYGASGFGREVAWLIEACAENGMAYQPVCFVDDDLSKHGKSSNGIPVMGLEQAVETYPGAFVVAGTGTPAIREKLMRKTAAKGYTFETVIHPRVERSLWIEIGEGTVICAGTILTTNIKDD